ncbi:hypothetical protein [Fundidesulfovibrio magnetotacticus]|nr:hypothetical protein [Fundidesulfovibrio magnetotacticus]
MDLADDAQAVEALEREAAVLRAVRGRRQEDQVFNRRGEVVFRWGADPG